MQNSVFVDSVCISCDALQMLMWNSFAHEQVQFACELQDPAGIKKKLFTLTALGNK